MKKLLIVLACFFTFIASKAQQDTIRKNAISLGAKTGFTNSVEIAYDRLLSGNSNFEVFFGIGTNPYNFLANNPQIQSGFNFELYPNGHYQNMIRFMFNFGLQGGYGRGNNFYYNGYYGDVGGYSTITGGPLAGIGLAYFGRGGFHFKVQNSIGLSYYSTTFDQPQYYYNDNPYGEPIPNYQTVTQQGINFIFKPTIRFGYRF